MTMDFLLVPGVTADSLATGSGIEIAFRMRDGDLREVVRFQGATK